MLEAAARGKPVGFVVVGLTLLAGMVLAVIPVPQQAPAEIGFVRPDWVAMILLYWIIALPHRFGMVFAWLIGFCMDILLGSLMGQHALSYLFIAWITINIYQRLRMFMIWQQAVLMFVLLGLNRLINFQVENITGFAEWSFWMLMPALSGGLLWPWVFLVLRYFRRSFDIT